MHACDFCKCQYKSIYLEIPITLNILKRGKSYQVENGRHNTLKCTYELQLKTQLFSKNTNNLL